ncbi:MULTISPECIES: tripartite tricarboxylate transporter substrate binding protein [Ramlibacter]|uniref:Tripartite tricarboxylate transporter substrate binding protein n=1 Tax=Ramlibacter pinisoli TaxID=2682844 RepID=A0A6N8IN10_9BURK|nr:MULTISPECIES: tripartite tricarboxylate transporter substrate binding protein [Ramlibacter]MBA2960624.1 tripartite tricarboxylate transporter substrate binding protein [Ramlibacter sp. CGMCC 1.13660]MVQ27955.1 tripartite tricarboxylate transporter substrate binding protein [Ramlibacter pinisoli]
MPRVLLRSLLLATTAVAALAAAAPAAAAYPDKPIRLVVPFSAGGTVDVVARAVGQQLGRQLATTVVVENVPGAGGAIATQRVAKAPADGYTLLFTTPNHTINPALNDKLPFDPEKNLAPVSLVAQIPELLVASAGQPFSDLAGLVKAARSQPGQLTYASAGNGTLPHVTMELLLQRLGIQLTHVPYKGAAPALNDLLAGQVAVKMDTVATSAAHIRAGRIKPLAIAGLRRSPLMPEVPTIAESGVPGYQGILWMGILAPAGTRPELLEQLHRAIAAIARQPEFLRQLDAGGVEVVASDPASFGKQIRDELRQWAEVVKASHIKAE